MAKAATAKRITSDDIVSEIIKLLQKKVYQPGDRLREQEIADRFGVSRGPVREALRALEAKCLVKIEPMRGATVMRLSDKDHLDSVEIGATLFALAARKASGCSDDHLARMQTYLGGLIEMLDQNVSSKEFYLQTIRLGVAVMRAAESDRLSALLTDIRTGAPDLFGPLGFTTPALRKQAVRKWRRLIGAIKKNDPDVAEKLAAEVNMDSLNAALEIVG